MVTPPGLEPGKFLVKNVVGLWRQREDETHSRFEYFTYQRLNKY